MLRTHTCGELRIEHVDRVVTLAGWVDTWRDHSGILFVDLRDRYGRTQVVFGPEAGEDNLEIARSLRSEFVISITGIVAVRPEGMTNPKLETGDVQERLIGSIDGWRKVVWNVRRLVDGAKALGVPVVATEQYPKGLGHTVPELAERLEEVCPGGIPEKMTFSSGGCPGAFEGFRDRGVRKILVAGIEAHVCVAQTVFDLMADGWRIYVAVDAVGSRFGLDYRTALARMDSAGATLTTTEAALFELCEVAGTPEFKEISRLAKESEPKA